jgi:hypothetical protein
MAISMLCFVSQNSFHGAGVQRKRGAAGRLYTAALLHGPEVVLLLVDLARRRQAVCHPGEQGHGLLHSSQVSGHRLPTTQPGERSQVAYNPAR